MACARFKSFRELFEYLYYEQDQEPYHVYITRDYGIAEYRNKHFFWVVDKETGEFVVYSEVCEE